MRVHIRASGVSKKERRERTIEHRQIVEAAAQNGS
jgi:hypothetical protein